jgi:hypothetical protein
MYGFHFRFIAMLMVSFPLLLLPAEGRAQGYRDKPPIAQALVLEGPFAVELEAGLNLGTSRDESVAEQRLARVGIAPENGWRSDEPMTPEILGQVQDSIIRAVENGWLHMGKKEALDRFRTVASSFDLPVKPYAGETGMGEYARTYSDQAYLDSYYAQEGPPVITYYTPPPGYYRMYTWVPYPFWWYNVLFSGYYILNGPVIVGHGHHGFRHHYHDHGFRHHGFRGDRDKDRDDRVSSRERPSVSPGAPTLKSRPARPGPVPNSISSRTSPPPIPNARMDHHAGKVPRDVLRGNRDGHRTERMPPVMREGPAGSHAPGAPTLKSRPARPDPVPNSINSRTSPPAVSPAGTAPRADFHTGTDSHAGRVPHDVLRGSRDGHRTDRVPPVMREGPAGSHAPDVPALKSQPARPGPVPNSRMSPPPIPNARMSPPAVRGMPGDHTGPPEAAGRAGGREPVGHGHPGGHGKGMRTGFHGEFRK